MNKDTQKNKKSPLLDRYIQKQNQEAKFDQMDEQEIATAIRALLDKDGTSADSLN